MTNNEKFIKRLKEIMKDKNVTIKDLSEQTELPINFLKRLLNARIKLIKARVIIKICSALKVSADYILGLTNKIK